MSHVFVYGAVHVNKIIIISSTNVTVRLISSDVLINVEIFN